MPKAKFVYFPKIVLSLFFSLMLVCLYPDKAIAADQIVEMQTTKGPIIMRIFYSVVPYTAGNFLDLVEQGFYNGLSFHRVENWCIQGGDPNGNGSGNYADPSTGQPRFINLEINRNLNHNSPGVVAMARSQNPNSASCQFYILKAAMPQLNGKYAVFGKVMSGMQSVNAIRPGDRILSARIILPQAAKENTPAASNSSANSSLPNSGTRNAEPLRTNDSGF